MQKTNIRSGPPARSAPRIAMSGHAPYAAQRPIRPQFESAQHFLMRRKIPPASGGVRSPFAARHRSRRPPLRHNP